MVEQTLSAQEEQTIINTVLDPEIRDDPYAWVMTCFCWGKANTPLANHKQPRKWQEESLKNIARTIYQHKVHHPLEVRDVYREAVASGRGIGKSAFDAWLAWWFFTTRIGSSTVVAANGKPQLMSYTFPELRKWITLSLNAHWADATTTKITPAPVIAQRVKQDLQIDPSYWFIEGKLWSEENPDAFAGAHNHLGMMLLFDEASGIPSPIWNVAEGYFTEPINERFWFAASNPRRAEGAFFDCFNKQAHRWRHKHIDSRSVEGLDKKVFDKLVEDYGEDSDIVRVEVKGQFPVKGFDQFIPPQAVAAARIREVTTQVDYDLVMGVDVARFGDDMSVVVFRKGNDARTIPMRTYQGLRATQLADKVADLYYQYKPDFLVVDAGGVGGGVADILVQMGLPVKEFDGSEAASDERFLNKRAETWEKLRVWLDKACLPDDDDLERDMLAPKLEYTEKGRIKLESKKDIKARGGASPDRADALAMTLSVRSRVQGVKQRRRTASIDYDPLQ